ncbi:hypothetical protein Tco_0892104 [Tanacetum coccineum]|uniref:Reverse transcriptase domain-containing protein n=1 Tax=Tanacetum coccineum TaxID=301880 RepID=A0ABQ5C7Z4_9ASTR
MHTRASNSELVEPLPEPERTLNQRLRRRNRRVPFNQRNNPPQNPRVVYPPILDINHFRQFLVILENLYPMDDEPMWAADHVVEPNLSSGITILETANEFAIKAGGIFLYKIPNQAYQLLEDKVLLKLDWAKNQKTKSTLKKTVALADRGSSNSDTNKIMARMDAMTLKMDTQYKELQSKAKKLNPILMKMKYPFIRVKHKQLNLGVRIERMIFHIDSAMKHSYSNDDTHFIIDVIDEILEEDFDALLNEGSKILHSIKETLIEKEIFVEFDEFMAMTSNENSNSKSDTEKLPFQKITINTDYKIKTSLEEPPTDLALKPLPDNLEYVFLEEPSFLPVIISSQLS